MKTVRKIWKFLTSMKFAVALLVILAIACSLASLVTQGQTYSWYAQRYSERTAALIIAFHLDDAFHSAWFLTITAFLTLNLFFCSMAQIKGLLARTRAAKLASETADVTADGVESPEEVFKRLGMPEPKLIEDAEGRETLFASKNRAGIWGAWVCHIGILLIILGFALGQMTHEEYTVYGVPGQSKTIGDTGLILTIDSFRVDLREDDTVEQYEAGITVRNALDGSNESAKISVNNPADLYGMRFYQNSTGWAAKVSVTKSGEPLQETVLCAGELLPIVDKPELIVYFNAFYPDYYYAGAPATASGRLNNPGYLYSVYYNGEMLGMNVLTGTDVLTIDEYTVTFSEPQSYTLIQIKRDPFAWLALVGGLVTMLGLFLAFYIQPKKVWAVREESGKWTVSASSRKGGELFRESFYRAVKPENGGENDG
ncbi:MAG: cytochrome c biogenesis protein ResB [Oscillospiraceae bacterium]|nr:cytochrome c biogenesis protein ResB [Oscillospiraceae bacterium]